MSTSAERMARLRARKKENGLSQVTVFVPKERVRDLEDLARRWREEMSGQGDLIARIAMAPPIASKTLDGALTRAIELAQAGEGYRRIKAETGLPERRCRDIARQYRSGARRSS